ncbi:MAG: MBL fold metallo-hydrolase [Proteobacteria bacterium]|nr:MBL fold metallo-hydrolase [Pseudomonadota bacterium]
MKVTVIYDNRKFADDLISDWGFSCFIEAYGKNYLFDTGSNAGILLDNMKKLKLDKKKIDVIFISHPHLDHTGGLKKVLEKCKCKVYIPYSFPRLSYVKNAVRIEKFTMLEENFYSTGELGDIEQSLIIKIKGGVAIIVGCGHPGIKRIIRVASEVGRPLWLIGGLHGFNDFDAVKDIDYVCPLHSTFFASELKSIYPEKFIYGGVGKVLQIEEMD